MRFQVSQFQCKLALFCVYMRAQSSWPNFILLLGPKSKKSVFKYSGQQDKRRETCAQGQNEMAGGERQTATKQTDLKNFCGGAPPKKKLAATSREQSHFGSGIFSFVTKGGFGWFEVELTSQATPAQLPNWEMYRLEHLAFASNMEEEMKGWINYPWHVVYSALRCMACQDWKRPHACPVCGAMARNNGGTYDAWAYMRGCLTHLNSAPKCMGTLLLEDPLNARGNPLIPTVATLLTELSPEKLEYTGSGQCQSNQCWIGCHGLFLGLDP